MMCGAVYPQQVDQITDQLTRTVHDCRHKAVCALRATISIIVRATISIIVRATISIIVRAAISIIVRASTDWHHSASVYAWNHQHHSVQPDLLRHSVQPLAS